jgi:hypothetical protein
MYGTVIKTPFFDARWREPQMYQRQARNAIEISTNRARRYFVCMAADEESER